MMKVVAVLMVLVQIGFAQEIPEYHHCYFPESSINGALSYSHSLTENKPGAAVKLNYNFTEKLGAGVEFSTIEFDAKKLDFGLQTFYVFDVLGAGISPAIGINYKLTAQETAFVLGGGVHRNFKRLTLFADYVHHFSDEPENFISIGLMYNLYHFEKEK